jgi:tripartite-type tricarboxylate transporter receptor subunit TctC
MAQAYPGRPVQIVVAASASGATDITARLIGQWLSDRLSQSFLIENGPAANNAIGKGAVEVEQSRKIRSINAY